MAHGNRQQPARKCLLGVMLGIASCVLTAPAASAAIKIGETFVPGDDNCGTDETWIQVETPGDTYTIPSDGVVTSWSHRGDVSSPKPVAVKIVRHVSGPTYHAVGSSAVHAPPAGELFTGNLTASVKAGDLIGLYVQQATGCRRATAPGFNGRTRTGEHGFDTDENYSTVVFGSQLDLSVVLEPDADRDGLGDDSQDPDDDADGREDAADNCPSIPNPDQANADAVPDGGDACDPDDDDDGLSDAEELALGLDPLRPDTDGDARLDRADNCPVTPNPGQDDFDQDGSGDACDPPGRGACVNVHTGTQLADRITGTLEGDRVLALGGKDAVDGRTGDDCLDGGGSGDRLSGGEGKDRLDGRDGADRLTGDDGADRLSGGDDGDSLNGGAGKDAYSGGDGKDSINAADGNREKVDCGAGIDKVTADPNDKLKKCERVRRKR